MRDLLRRHSKIVIDINYEKVYIPFLSVTQPAPGLVSSDLADRFGLILELLRRTAAAKLASNRAATPMLLLLWARIHRLTLRFSSLVGRIGAGTLRAPRHSTPRPRRVTPPGPRLPAAFGWLTQLVPETRGHACQLQFFLSQPDMVALLSAEPRFARMLRPLCRMLALPPQLLPARSSASRVEPRRSGSEVCQDGQTSATHQLVAIIPTSLATQP